MLGIVARRMELRIWQFAFVWFLILAPKLAFAHTSEGGFVLLLPTGVYIIAGTIAVILSIVVISLLPTRHVKLLFNKSIPIMKIRPQFMAATSLISGAIFWILIGVGIYGPRDPLENLLVLVIWTLWWQAFLIVQALFGNLWAWLNPWVGLHQLIWRKFDVDGIFSLPERIGKLPAIIAYVVFGLFLLADIAPDDPFRLAIIAAAYWVYIFIGMTLFGAKTWLEKAECFTVMLHYISMFSPFAISRNTLRVGFPGWRIVGHNKMSITGAVFVIMVLATGSFDGLNETFWWFGNIGINPLAFPGRSAVVLQNSVGLIGANILLVSLTMLCIWGGYLLARSSLSFSAMFPQLALSLVPIAIGYHFSHYLTAFLVNIQYVITALSDPLNTGANYFGLGQHFVSSGFLNSQDSVKTIWISQATGVVIGHVIGVLSAHGVAVKQYKTPDQVLYSQLPMAIFMIAYTVFGLWLLATPRGV